MKKAFVNSLPKAGTNLVAKCLQLFGYSDKGIIGSFSVLNVAWPARVRRMLWMPIRQGYLIGIDTPVEVARSPVDRMLQGVGDDMFLIAHIGYTTDLLFKVIDLGFSPIVVVRDPRAVLVSFVHYVMRKKTHVLHQAFAAMSEEDRYLAGLKGAFCGHATLQPLRVRCMALDSWLSSEKVLQVKFEELVGSKGGGSDSVQRETLNQICDWLNIPKDKIDHVSTHLFGPGRHTFRKGQIDSWQDEIPLAIVRVVEDQLGDILETWGYS